MIDQPFRSWLSGRANGLLKMYSAIGLSPNGVTVLAFLTSCLSAGMVAMDQLWAALSLWWLSRLFDGTDGIYARSLNRVTHFGGYLDIVLDMAAYTIMVVGFAHARPQFGLLWLLITFGYVMCISSALALGSLERKAGVGAADNRSLKLGAGIAEGGETGIFYSLLLIFPNWTGQLATAWLAVLFTTVIARTLLARRELN